MDQASKHLIDSELIGKYLAGEATPEEVIVLEDWIAVSAANQLIFEQYASAWQGAGPGGSHQVPDKNEAWRLLTAKTSSNSSRKTIPLPSHFWIAAVIAGIACLSIIPLLFFRVSENRATSRSITIASDGKIKQTGLPDGSSVILNSHSSIRFAPEFAPDQRNASLQGEAYFDIIRDSSRPFVVSFEDVNIRVLGTSFNVRKNESANSIETQVVSGWVKMFNEKGEIVISAEQIGIYSKSKNSFALRKHPDINSVAYATKRFIFSDESLATIVEYLGKAYSKTIVVRQEAIGRCRMTSSFENKSIEYILDVIAATLNVTYTINGNIIYIEGGEHEGC